MLAERLQRPNSGCEHSEEVVGAFQQWRQRCDRQATFWWPCTSVNPQNEECFDQLISSSRRITTRELCTELNIGFNALEMMFAMLEYCKVCARWVLWMLTQEHKDHLMQVCQDLLNHYEAEGNSFLDRIISGDMMWCHHYEPESKQQSMEWRHANFPSKKKLKTQPPVGKVMCTVFGIGKA
jgi:hypothetical protein